MATFPHHLCSILLAGFSEQAAPSVLRSEVERGIPRHRRSSADAMVTATVPLLFATAQASADFDTWFYADALGGAAWFDFTHPRTGAVVQARVVGGEVGAITPLAAGFRVAQRTIALEYTRSSFVQLPPGLHTVDASRIVSVQRNSPATYVDGSGVLQTAAANVARYTYSSDLNLYGGPADLVAGPGAYGVNHYLKTETSNPANLQPGDVITLSAQVYQDAASLADGPGRVARLFCWFADAAGNWLGSVHIDGAGLSAAGRASATLTLPALAADMVAVGVGVYHIGGSASYLGTVRADAVMVERGAVATAYGPGVFLLVENEVINLAPHPSDLASWVDNGGLPVVSNAMLAPDGTMTADTTTAGHTRFVQITGLADGVYTVSRYVRPADVDASVYIYTDGVFGVSTYTFFPRTLVAGYPTGTAQSGKIEALAGGWYRMQMALLVTGGTLNFHTYPTNDDLHGWWHAQVERGTQATSPVTGTRAADLITVVA